MKRQYQLEIRGEGYWDDWDPGVGHRVRSWRLAMKEDFPTRADAQSNFDWLVSKGVSEADLRIVSKPRHRRTR